MANTKTKAASAEKNEAKNTIKYEAKFYSLPTEGSVKGICNVTLNDEFTIKGVKVVEGSKGLFMAMPSYKSGDEYKDICFPITKDGRQNLSKTVLDAYETAKEEMANEVVSAENFDEGMEAFGNDQMAVN